VTVHETRRDESVGFYARTCFFVGEERAPLAVCDGDGQSCTAHSIQQNGWALLDTDHREPGLELFGAIANEARPVFCARNEVAEMGEHLTAVADAECEARFVAKEGFELVTQAVVVQDGFGPTASGSEDIAIGKAAARDEALE